jgi:hypothetical protein
VSPTPRWTLTGLLREDGLLGKCICSVTYTPVTVTIIRAYHRCTTINAMYKVLIFAERQHSEGRGRHVTC